MRVKRIRERLDDVQALLRMYNEPPLDQFADSPEIAELIRRVTCEEERLLTLLSEASTEEVADPIAAASPADIRPS